MEWLTAPEFWLSRWLFVRLLALVYLVAFVNAALQFRPLLGEHGLLPVTRYLERVSFRSRPSLFHLYCSDRFAVAVAWAGVALSVLLAVGVPQSGPVWAYVLVWLVTWALYLSIVNVGQTWYGFGWESILLEAGFFAAFLGPDTIAPPVLAIFMVRWLLFRVEFGAGLIKLRGDQCWRDLTCLEYHHETQPLPGPFSWHAHHLPRWWHKTEVAGNHVAQLMVPFALFAPPPFSSAAAVVIIVTQGWLVATGNFAWLNAVTMVLAVTGIADVWLDWLPVGVPDVTATPPWFNVVVVVIAIGVLVMSWWPVRNMASRTQLMNVPFNPFHLVSTYGAFGSITRTRHEVALEGTEDPSPGPASHWHEYGFKGKPGDPRRRPPQVAPYHLRLDWLMWFAAMSSPALQPWLTPLVERLLSGDKAVLKLLRTNPFPDSGPAAIRASLYRYRFTSRAERRETGRWWTRDHVGEYLPPLRLSENRNLVRARPPNETP